MGNAPANRGACCLPNVDGVTYLKIGAREITVGMMGLDRVFEQLFVLERNPEETSDAELVGMARRFNYISDRPQIEADYGAALRRAYAAYYARQEKKA
jgi:hypothetical protein